MPKERIQHGRIWASNGQTLRPYVDDNGVLLELLPNESLRTDPSLDVVWNRDGNGGVDGWVQVQLEIDAEQIKSRTLDGPAVFTTDTMTRHQINSMIRVLRRARDQAFGVDE